MAYEYIFTYIFSHVQEKLDTSNYPAVNTSGIPTGVNKIVIGMFKDKLGGSRKYNSRLKFSEVTAIKFTLIKLTKSFSRLKIQSDTFYRLE